MKQYLDYLQDVLNNGVERVDRTGVGTLSVFGRQMRFDLQQGFPLLTTKKLHIRSIIYELLWFLQGNTNTQYLNDNGVRIWNEWADDQGELGPVYGKQWRSWGKPDGSTVDQIAQVLHQIKNTPTSRRLIVNAWNVGELDKMALPPCHMLFQFYVAEGSLSCMLYQRSVDSFLGLPFNIASYSLLTHMVAQQCNLDVGEFVWTGGDCHVYLNHREQAALQIQRIPYALPQLKIKSCPRSLFDYAFEDFEILNYKAHPHIKGPIAV